MNRDSGGSDKNYLDDIKQMLTNINQYWTNVNWTNILDQRLLDKSLYMDQSHLTNIPETAMAIKS